MWTRLAAVLLFVIAGSVANAAGSRAVVDFGYPPRDGGKALNNFFREGDYDERVYFVKCRKWEFEKLYSCEYKIGLASIFAVSKGPKSNTFRWIVMSPYNDDGVEDLGVIGTAAVSLAFPDIDIVDTMRVVMAGIDLAGDTGTYETSVNRMYLGFERSVRLNRVRIILQTHN